MIIQKERFVDNCSINQFLFFMHRKEKEKKTHFSNRKTCACESIIKCILKMGKKRKELNRMSLQGVSAHTKSSNDFVDDSVDRKRKKNKLNLSSFEKKEKKTFPLFVRCMRSPLIRTVLCLCMFRFARATYGQASAYKFKLRRWSCSCSFTHWQRTVLVPVSYLYITLCTL